MKGPKQIVDIPISGGVESKIYKALVQPGRVLRSDGARFDRPGSVSMLPVLEEYSEEAGGICTGIISDGIHEPVTLDADDIDPVRVTKIAVPPPSSVTSTGAIYSADMASYGDIAYTILTPHSGLHTVIKTNIKTGESSVLLASGASARPFRIIICGCHRYVFFIYEPSTTIRYYYQDLSSGQDTIGTEYNATPVAASSATIGFTVCRDSDPTKESDGYCWLCWCNAANQLQVTEVHQSSYTLKKSFTDVCVAAPAIVSSPTNTNRYWIAAPHAAGVWGYCYNDGGSSVRRTMVSTAGTYYTPVGIEYEDNIAYFYCPWETAGAYPHYILTRIGKLTDLAGSEQSTVIYGVHPSSTPIMRDFHVCFWARYIKASLTNAAGEEQEQATEFLVKSDPEATTNIDAGYAIASAIERDAVGPATYIANQPLMIPSTLCEDQYGNWLYAAISEPLSLLDLQRNGIVQIIKASFGVPLRQAVIGDKLVLSGGFAFESVARTASPSRAVVESGFVLYPEIISVTPGSGGTGSLLAQTYYIKVLFKSIDDNGRQVLSGVSVEDSALAVATGSLVVRVPYYLMGRRICRAEPYISTDNINYYLANGFFALHQLTGPPASYQDLTVTSYDNTTPLLYTVGGIIENGNARCITDIVAHNNRLYGVTPDGTLLYTKPFVSGVGAEWSPGFLEHSLLSDGGEFWQIASMDGQLIAIGENGIQAVVGDGADNIGADSTLSQPIRISSSIGIARDSVANQSFDGVWYNSKSGINLLMRSNETDSFIGMPINELIKATVLKSCSKSAATNEVFFGMSDGSVYVFNANTRSWSSMPSSNIGGNNQAMATDADGNLWVLNSDTGRLYVSYLVNPDYTDAQMAIETPWLRVGSIGGRQRIGFAVINGEWLSDMTLSVGAYYDFDETVVDQITDDYEDTIATPRSAGDPFVWRQHIGRRCSSVKFKIVVEKSDGADSGACCRLFGFSIELAQKPNVLAASSDHER